MPGNLTLKYGTAASLTITLASLAASSGGVSGRASTAVDNSTTDAIDYLVQVTLKNGAGAIAGNKGWWVFVYAANGGTSYDDGISGTDAAFTRTDPPNLRLLAFINAPASATQYVSATYSIAAAFGGACPQKWGLFVANDTNSAADATAANFGVESLPVLAQYT